MEQPPNMAGTPKTTNPARMLVRHTTLPQQPKCYLTLRKEYGVSKLGSLARKNRPEQPEITPRLTIWFPYATSRSIRCANKALAPRQLARAQTVTREPAAKSPDDTVIEPDPSP
jgi:hypothetical protein